MDRDNKRPTTVRKAKVAEEIKLMTFSVRMMDLALVEALADLVASAALAVAWEAACMTSLAEDSVTSEVVEEDSLPCSFLRVWVLPQDLAQ